MAAATRPLTSLADWLAWLETLSPREIDLGLERVQAVLARLELPRPRRVVHVAGTNGKGSTVAMLESLYAGAGATVAAYTSPHVLRYNERLRVAGRELDDASIVAAFETVEAARGDVPLTYFEYGTLAALVAFAAAGADTWVLEIGLGGRLDAVNALDPDGVVITSISLDHTDWLGPDIESIAREKAGVMRAGIPAVFAGSPVPRAIVDAAAGLGCDLRLAGRDYRCERRGAGFAFRGRDLELPALAAPALAGSFQFANAAGALALYEALEGPAGVDADFVDRAFAGLSLSGRLQHLACRERHWLLDVAHNPGAAAALADELAADGDARRRILMLGVLADKDLDGILAPLLPRFAGFVAVPPASPRALPAMALGARIAAASGRACRVADSVAAGLDAAAALARAGDLIVVSGSFYTVGPALERLRAAG